MTFRQLFTRMQDARPASAPEAEVDWRLTLRRRVMVGAGLFAIWAVGIELKLVYLQVFQRASLEARAKEQQQRVITDPATRGDILDRNGHILATSADAESIFAVPSEIKDRAAAVDQLCAAFRDCTKAERQSLLQRFTTNKNFAWVRRRASEEHVERVQALHLKYVNFQRESRRSYPNGELAAHVLGRVGTDNQGLAGIEYAYNKQVRGRDGQVVIQTDGKGQVWSRTEEPPTPGASLELTIDEAIQHVAERELHAAVIENRALGGSAVVINPHTGEILAMANEPTFDPNEPIDAMDPRIRNRAIQDLYEPGSTFKIVTASAAVEGNVVPLDYMIDTSPGQLRVGSSVFHDTANHGVLSFADVIADSSNVGAIRIGLKVGAERLSHYVSAFGFGHPTSSDFLSESSGRTWPVSAWTDLTVASVSIGYQVGVTPLQMLSAVATIANGGALVEPRVVGALYRDNLRNPVRPKVVRQVISPDTAATLTGIMEGVVEHGTGKAAQIPGFTVAGKTGTAQKVVDGHYSSSYNASFVGFVPSRDPKLAIIVVIDSPKAKGYYGGLVSAPVFQKIAVSALRHLGVAPTVNPTPPVLVPRAAIPAQAAPATRNPSVRLVANSPAGIVPDLHGLSLREATRQLATLGIRVLPFGDGFVVSQSLEPGASIEPGSTCRLDFARVGARR